MEFPEQSPSAPAGDKWKESHLPMVEEGCPERLTKVGAPVWIMPEAPAWSKGMGTELYPVWGWGMIGTEGWREGSRMTWDQVLEQS
jgi:hypothetical protein